MRYLWIARIGMGSGASTGNNAANTNAYNTNSTSNDYYRVIKEIPADSIVSFGHPNDKSTKFARTGSPIKVGTIVTNIHKKDDTYYTWFKINTTTTEVPRYILLSDETINTCLNKKNKIPVNPYAHLSTNNSSSSNTRTHTNMINRIVGGKQRRKGRSNTKRIRRNRRRLTRHK